MIFENERAWPPIVMLISIFIITTNMHLSPNCPLTIISLKMCTNSIIKKVARKFNEALQCCVSKFASSYLQKWHKQI